METSSTTKRFSGVKGAKHQRAAAPPAPRLMTLQLTPRHLQAEMCSR